MELMKDPPNIRDGAPLIHGVVESIVNGKSKVVAFIVCNQDQVREQVAHAIQYCADHGLNPIWSHINHDPVFCVADGQINFYTPFSRMAGMRFSEYVADDRIWFNDKMVEAMIHKVLPMIESNKRDESWN